MENIFDIIQKTLLVLEGGPVRGRRVPLYLPDGSEVTSVRQVAAMMDVTEKVAGLYVLETKELNHLHYQVKGFTPPPSSDKNGIAVMLYTTLDVARQIAIDGGTKPEDIHLTLGYFGKMGINDDTELEEDLAALCRKLAASKEPFTVTVNGLTRFNGNEGEPDPLVVTADSPDVEDLRRMLVLTCEDQALPLIRNHGYVPHFTLGMLDEETPNPMHRWNTLQVPIKWVVLGYGPNYSVFPLGTDVDETKDVHSGSLGAVSSLRTDTSVVSRITGRVKRVKTRRRKPKLTS